MDHIYLVPGFFGFANLGDLRYFGPVVDYLDHHIDGPKAIHVVRTSPTSSLPKRAVDLHQTIVSTADEGDRLYIVGHSSGGLDARLWASPGTVLPGDIDPEPLAQQLRAVVTVSTPHHGTPSAELFTTVAGKRLLRVLSLMTIIILRRGGTPLQAALRMGDWFVAAEGLLNAKPDVLDEVFHRLLTQLSEDRRDEVEAFFREIGDDQGLLPQLIPDAMTLFEASARDRPGVRYGAVITRAKRPGLAGVVASGLSPVAQSAFVMFAACWKAASRLNTTPEMPVGLLDALRARWPDVDTVDNDGMVPTLSQARGELIRAVDADHLDVLGHFGDSSLDPPSYDWFTTGTGFTRTHFDATWTDVVHFLAEAT